MRSFGSDNNSGAHPRMLAAIAEANVDHAIAYGDDDWTRRAENVIRKMLDRNNIDPVFVFNGTGAKCGGAVGLSSTFSVCDLCRYGTYCYRRMWCTGQIHRQSVEGNSDTRW